MAALGSTALTMVDLAKQLNPDGSLALIAEVLNKSNPILDEMTWMEGNLPTGHRYTQRTGLPTPFYRSINETVPTTKSLTAQITENSAMLEDWSEVDPDLARLSGDVKAFRYNEALAHLEGMSQTFASKLFYGNAGTSPKEFTGLATRFNDTTAGNGQNVIKAGGVGSDNSSIYLVGWGPRSITGIYPKGSQAGLVHNDLGEQTISGSTSGVGTERMRVLQDQYKWSHGIALLDWRYVVRIANIDISDLASSTTSADLLKLMILAYHRLPNGATGSAKFAWYGNRTIAQALHIQVRDATTYTMTPMTVAGKPVDGFMNIPFRVCDSILNTESLAS